MTVLDKLIARFDLQCGRRLAETRHGKDPKILLTQFWLATAVLVAVVFIFGCAAGEWSSPAGSHHLPLSRNVYDQLHQLHQLRRDQADKALFSGDRGRPLQRLPQPLVRGGGGVAERGLRRGGGHGTAVRHVAADHMPA